jgi:hypothetical protein
MADRDFYNFLLSAYKNMVNAMADDASIYVIAMPSQQGHHTFEGFIINGTEEIYEESVEINHNNKDINILAKFEEWWIKVSADANPTD